jgi:hypothetical protein
MQYLILIYGDETAEMSEDDMGGSMERWFAYTDWLVQKGWMRGGDALQPTSQATSVTTRGGDRVVTDGPFAETKEQLGGYYLIEVDNLDDAIEAAGRCPGAAYGTIEVRPIADLPPRES